MVPHKTRAVAKNNPGVLGLAIRVLGLAIRVLGLAIRVLGLAIRVLGLYFTNYKFLYLAL
jgi:hypothetical protein